MRPEAILYAAISLDRMDENPDLVAEVIDIDVPAVVARAARHLGLDVEHFMLASVIEGMLTEEAYG